MTKFAAFGTAFNMGVRQVESTPIVGTITGDGDASVTITFTGMTGSGVPTAVAVVTGDTPSVVADKAVAVLNADGDFAAKAFAYSDGIYLRMIALAPAANDAAMNIAYDNDSCTGLTGDATSDNLVAGVALTAIAQVSNIGGPGLSADTEDVTTHDSTGAWEEHVVTVLRSGEVSLDLVYDPSDGSHDATSGLLAMLEDKANYLGFSLVFPGPYTWSFNGYSTGFEPGAPHDGALTATATIKITGAPTLV